MNLLKIKEFLKNKLQFKHIAYAAIFLLIAGLSFQSYRLSIKLNELSKADVAIILLNEQIKHKVDSIKTLNNQKLFMKDRVDSLNVIIGNLEKQKTNLSNKLDSALNVIDTIPPDDNYKYLQEVAYPYQGELKYPFNGIQVTEIRKDFTRVDGLQKINLNLETTVIKLKTQSLTKDSIITNQDLQIDLYKDINSSCQDLVAIKTDQIKDLNKDIKKQKRITYFLQTISMAEAIYILISLL